MANPRGTFAPELLPEGWFDETLRPEGWFSQDFLEPVTAGGNAVFVGTTAITISQSGVLRSTTALTGTSPLTFSQTGDFTAGAVAGNADFVGSATLVFGQSGVFAARAAFVGSTPVAFSQSGAFRGGASLSGTSTIAFSQSGTLRSGAGLQGATALSFTQLGDFVAGAGGANANFVGTSTIIFGQSGDFVAGQGSQGQNKGDDAALRRKKPIIIVRPKVEVELEEALETLETVRPSDRVASNKAKVRKALQTVKAIEAPPSYANAIANIEANLKAVSRATAKHEGMMNALLTVAMEMQNLIAEMQRNRAQQRKRNMEKLLWLL